MKCSGNTRSDITCIHTGARRGITLYEVVIAIAIFAGAIAALSEALTTATRAALQSRMQSQAVLLCETKMAEIVAGATPATSAGENAFTDAGLDGWTWKVNVTPGAHAGINQVDVTVNCRQAASSVDASFTMTRLLRDQQAFVTSATQAAKEKALQAGVANQQSQAAGQ
jgi:type II secretion system protein I